MPKPHKQKSPTPFSVATETISVPGGEIKAAYSSLYEVAKSTVDLVGKSLGSMRETVRHVAEFRAKADNHSPQHAGEVDSDLRAVLFLAGFTSPRISEIFRISSLPPDRLAFFLEGGSSVVLALEEARELEVLSLFGDEEETAAAADAQGALALAADAALSQQPDGELLQFDTVIADRKIIAAAVMSGAVPKRSLSDAVNLITVPVEEAAKKDEALHHIAAHVGKIMDGRKKSLQSLKKKGKGRPVAPRYVKAAKVLARAAAAISKLKLNVEDARKVVSAPCGKFLVVLQVDGGAK